jgi:endoglucanase
MKFKSKHLFWAGLFGLMVMAFWVSGLKHTVWGANGVVDSYGQLQVVGNQLCGSSGTPVALHGMSLFWTNWDTGFYNASVLQWLRDDWQCTVVRAAMGIEPIGAYLSDSGTQTQKVTTVVDAAINLGMYVIIDWHDHNAHQHTEQAKQFFANMAQRYGSYSNVIYEIYNEPESVSWATVKSYAETVIAAIRQYDPDNIIIVGTPTWSQDVDAPANDPINGSNIVYALHFYAGTHKQWLRDKATTALNKGIALFVSEWGTTDSDGDGAVATGESDTWIEFMKSNNLSWCNWSLFDKDESSAALQSGASLTGGWPESALKQSGVYVRNKLISLAKETPVITPTPSATVTATPTVTATSGTVSPTGSVTPSPTNSPQPSANADCAVTYTQNDWGSGATVSVTIKNNSGAAINGWSLTWNFTGNQKITNLWSAGFTQNGTAVTVTNASYDALIPAGGSVSFGFNLSYSGSNSKPAAFTLNGGECSVL